MKTKNAKLKPIKTYKNKNLSGKEYLNEIKPYSRDIIINLQKSKVQLTIAI